MAEGDTVSFDVCLSVCLCVFVRSGPVSQTSLKRLKLYGLQIQHTCSQGQSGHDLLKLLFCKNSLGGDMQSHERLLVYWCFETGNRSRINGRPCQEIELCVDACLSARRTSGTTRRDARSKLLGAPRFSVRLTHCSSTSTLPTKLCGSTPGPLQRCNIIQTIEHNTVWAVKGASFILGYVWQVWTDFNNSLTVAFSDESVAALPCEIRMFNRLYTFAAVIRFKSGAKSFLTVTSLFTVNIYQKMLSSRSCKYAN